MDMHLLVQVFLDDGKALENAKDLDDYTPFQYAAKHGHIAVVEALLKQGKIEITRKDKTTWTPFQWAVERGHEQVVKLMLDTGQIDVNDRDGDGMDTIALGGAEWT